MRAILILWIMAVSAVLHETSDADSESDALREDDNVREEPDESEMSLAELTHEPGDCGCCQPPYDCDRDCMPHRSYSKDGTTWGHTVACYDGTFGTLHAPTVGNLVPAALEAGGGAAIVHKWDFAHNKWNGEWPTMSTAMAESIARFAAFAYEVSKEVTPRETASDPTFVKVQLNRVMGGFTGDGRVTVHDARGFFDGGGHGGRNWKDSYGYVAKVTFPPDMFIEHNDYDCVVGIRGTNMGGKLEEKVGNWLNNFDVEKRSIGGRDEPNVDPDLLCKHCRVHQGFHRVWTHLRAHVYAAIEEFGCQRKHVYVTGHSLGGAVATIAQYALWRKYGDGIVVPSIVFNSPRVGNKDFALMMQHRFQLLRVTNAGDPVSHLPNYHYFHSDREVRFDYDLTAYDCLNQDFAPKIKKLPGGDAGVAAVLTGAAVGSIPAAIAGGLLGGLLGGPLMVQPTALTGGAAGAGVVAYAVGKAAGMNSSQHSAKNHPLLRGEPKVEFR